MRFTQGEASACKCLDSINGGGSLRGCCVNLELEGMATMNAQRCEAR